MYKLIEIERVVNRFVQCHYQNTITELCIIIEMSEEDFQNNILNSIGVMYTRDEVSDLILWLA